MIKISYRLLIAGVLTVLLISCGKQAEQPPSDDAADAADDQASAAYLHLDQTDPSGYRVNLVIAEVDEGVLLSGSISGFVPSRSYAMHIHNFPTCRNYTSVVRSAHFNPDQKRHGDPGLQEHHLGDLPNATADESGALHLDRVLLGARIGSDDPYDVLNRSFVVHELSDDYLSEPDGGAGWILACFAITR